MSEVTYGDFKTLENNVRECFDSIRRLAHADRELTDLVSSTLALARDLQTRISNIEQSLHGAAQRGPTEGQHGNEAPQR